MRKNAPSPRSRSTATAARRGWVWVVVLLLGLLTAPPLAAQSTQNRVGDRDLDYQTALVEYEAAVQAWEYKRAQWESALQRLRGSGRGDDQAWREFQTLSDELQRLDRRKSDLRGRLDRARAAFVVALEEHRRTLVAQRDHATTLQQRNGFQALLTDLDNQLRELRSPDVQVQRVSRALYEVDPRASREQLQDQVELVRARLTEADSLAAYIDREVERLEARIEEERRRRTSLADLRRFDDTRTPVGVPARRERDERTPVPADSMAVLQELAPEQQLERLQASRGEVEIYRQELEDVLGRLQDRLRRIT